MAKVSAGDIRNGVTIEVDGKVCQVIDFMHVKPGKGAALVRVKYGAVLVFAPSPTDRWCGRDNIPSNRDI